MKLDTDGLDGVFHRPASPSRQQSTLPKMSSAPQGTAVERPTGAAGSLMPRRPVPGRTQTIGAMKASPSIAPKRPAPSRAARQAQVPPKAMGAFPRGKTLAFMPAVVTTPPPAPVQEPVTAQMSTAPAPAAVKTSEPPNKTVPKRIPEPDRGLARTLISAPAGAPLTSPPSFPAVRPEGPVITAAGLGTPVPPMRDTLFDAVSSFAPEPEARPAESPSLPAPKRRSRTVPLLLCVVVALTAVFFGTRYEERDAAVRSVALPSLASPSTPSSHAPIGSREAPPGDPVVEAAFVQAAGPPDTPAAIRGGAQDEAAAVEAAPRDSAAIRFPGTYIKGEVHPQIIAWGEVDELFRSFRRSCKGQILITGHTCALGEEEANQYVSRRRAGMVYRYFVKRGFNRERLVVDGAGASAPIADNETEEGRVLNRRVEISCR